MMDLLIGAEGSARMPAAPGPLVLTNEAHKAAAPPTAWGPFRSSLLRADLFGRANSGLYHDFTFQLDRHRKRRRHKADVLAFLK